MTPHLARGQSQPGRTHTALLPQNGSLLLCIVLLLHHHEKVVSTTLHTISQSLKSQAEKETTPLGLST